MSETGSTTSQNAWSGYKPRLRAMISFWISVVPPKIDGTRLSRQSSRSWRRVADSFSGRSKAGLHLVDASRGVRAARSGRRSPSRGSSGRVAAPRAAAWLRRRHRTSGPDIPAVDADIDSGDLIAAQLPQVLAMHDASDGSQVRSCSREPPRGDQYLGLGEDAHDDSMGTCGRSMTTAAARPSSAGGSPPNSSPFRRALRIPLPSRPTARGC
jgi:hypothetical protein